MPHPSSQPDRRLRRGRVVSTRRGLCVVLKRQRDRVALVPICKGPGNTHRADIHPSWIDAATLGLKTCDVIRCAPFLLPHHVVYPMPSNTPETLMKRIWATACKEVQTQAREDATPRTFWNFV